MEQKSVLCKNYWHSSLESLLILFSFCLRWWQPARLSGGSAVLHSGAHFLRRSGTVGLSFLLTPSWKDCFSVCLRCCICLSCKGTVFTLQEVLPHNVIWETSFSLLLKTGNKQINVKSMDRRDSVGGNKAPVFILSLRDFITFTFSGWNSLA